MKYKESKKLELRANSILKYNVNKDKKLKSGRNRLIISRNSDSCPRCKKPMERRGHGVLTNKVKAQPYYYKEWDYCINCKYLKHYNSMKVWNRNEKSRRMGLFEEEQQNFNHLREI